MMDKLAIEASEQMAHAGYPVGRGAALLVELDGAEDECEARFEEVVRVCEQCGSDDVRVARDEAERQLFWKTRKAAFPAMGRIARTTSSRTASSRARSCPRCSTASTSSRPSTT